MQNIDFRLGSLRLNESSRQVEARGIVSHIEEKPSVGSERVFEATLEVTGLGVDERLHLVGRLDKGNIVDKNATSLSIYDHVVNPLKHSYYTDGTVKVYGEFLGRTVTDEPVVRVHRTEQ